MRSLSITLVCTLLISSTAISADQPSSGHSSDSTSVAQPNGVGIAALVEVVASKSHKRFVWASGVPAAIDLGTVNLRDVDYPALLAILTLNGCAAVENSGLVTILPRFNVRQEATRIVSPEHIDGPPDEWVTVVIPIKGVSASQLVPVLRPLMPQEAQLQSIADRNALVAVDRAANIKRLLQIIHTLEALPSARANEPPNT